MVFGLAVCAARTLPAAVAASAVVKLRRAPLQSQEIAEGTTGQTQETLHFGAIADVQYADVQVHRNRYYRGTLGVVERAVAFFNAGPPLHFILHAGDLVDFYNAENDAGLASGGGGQTQAAVDAVMQRLARTACAKQVFLVGNHELYNWSKDVLRAGVPWAASGKTWWQWLAGTAPSRGGTVCFSGEDTGELWHSFSPCRGWRCVVLDSYDVSVYSKGRGPGDPPRNYELDGEAVALVASHNPNVAEFVRERPGENILCNYFKDMPQGPARRWVPFNGALGARQLAWLRTTLEQCAARGERVVLMTHALVHPASTNGTTLLWNHEELLEVLRSPAGRSVQLVLHGHQHEGGFATDAQTGIHFLAFESPLNSVPGEGPGAFLTAEVGPTHCELRGYGNRGSPIFPDVAPGELGVRRLRLRAAGA